MLRRTLAIAAVLGLAAAAARADEIDPRPAILIVSDLNALPAGTGGSWAQLVQKKHPEWNVVVAAEAKRTIPELDATFDDAVAKPYNATFGIVLLFLGTNDAAAEAYAKADAAALAGHLKSILGKLRKNPGTAASRVVLVTPMPVVDARLDKWSQERFKGGEKNSDAIADAVRKLAADEKLALIDFHKHAKEDVADGKAGRLLGTIGWQMRDWGHPIAAQFFGPQIAALKPAPRDAAAFAAWQAEQVAAARLTQILAETSEGIVAHGPAFPSKAETISKLNCSVITVPPDALAGKSLDLVMFPTDKPQSAIGNGANFRAYHPRLSVTLAGAEKPVDIVFPGGGWQLIDETTLDTPVDPNLYRWNAQKMNYYGLTRSEPGKRAWMLVRLPLAAIAGQKVVAAQIVVPHPAGLERFENNAATPLKLDDLGHCTAAQIRPDDAHWDDALATWKTRDGRIGWTGGKVDAARRRAALEAFLKTSPPPGAARAAEQALAATK